MQKQSLSLIDIYNVVYEPWWHNTFVLISLTVVFGAVLISLIYFLYRSSLFKKKLSTIEQLQHILQKLLTEKYDDTKEIHDAYFTLTSVLKQVIFYFYRVDMHDKTDLDLADEINLLLPKEQSTILIDLLKRAFVVKYAYQQENSDQLIADILTIQKLIESLSAQFNKV